jgi:hypothetical protein
MLGCNSKEAFIDLDRTPTKTNARVISLDENASWPYYYWEAGEQVDTIYGRTVDLMIFDSQGDEIRTVHFKFSNKSSYQLEFEQIEVGMMYQVEIAKYLLLGQHDTSDGRYFYSFQPLLDE